MNLVYRMEYYTAIKRKEGIPFAEKVMDMVISY